MTGYKKDWLGIEVLPPRLSKLLNQESWNNGQLIEHTNFALVMHESRRSAIYSVGFYDGALFSKKWKRKAHQLHGYTPDPKVPDYIEPDRDHFAQPYDVGHLTPIKALAWGNTFEEVRISASETNYLSNMSPQSLNFNRDEWLLLEQMTQQAAKATDVKAMTINFPILDEQDPWFHSPKDKKLKIQVPQVYCKIIALATKEGVKVAGFEMPVQRFLDDGPFTSERKEIFPYQRPIRFLERISGLRFPEIKEFDSFELSDAISDDEKGMTRGRPIRHYKDIII